MLERSTLGDFKSIDKLLFLKQRGGYRSVCFIMLYTWYVHSIFCSNEMYDNKKYYLRTIQNLTTGMYKETITTYNSTIHRWLLLAFFIFFYYLFYIPALESSLKHTHTNWLEAVDRNWSLHDSIFKDRRDNYSNRFGAYVHTHTHTHTQAGTTLSQLTSLTG